MKKAIGKIYKMTLKSKLLLLLLLSIALIEFIVILSLSFKGIDLLKLLIFHAIIIIVMVTLLFLVEIKR